jgi:hypothetical protein
MAMETRIVKARFDNVILNADKRHYIDAHKKKEKQNDSSNFSNYISSDRKCRVTLPEDAPTPYRQETNN